MRATSGARAREGRPGQVEQIVMNLAVNAATPCRTAARLSKSRPTKRSPTDAQDEFTAGGHYGARR